MAIANAVTNGAGLRLIGGMDIHNLRTENIEGKKLNPWSLISWHDSSCCKFGDILSGEIFPKTEYRNAVRAAPYSVVVSYIRRTLDPHLTEPIKFWKSSGARCVYVCGTRFLVYGGKIYTKKGLDYEN
jgi:hypothetical protein